MTDSLRRSWQERLASDRSMRRISLAMRLSSVLLGVIICAFQGTLGQTWDLALLLAALGLVATSEAMLAGAVALVLTRCLSAEDAYRCFMATEIDCLIVGNRFLTRDRQANRPLTDSQREQWLRRFDLD